MMEKFFRTRYKIDLYRTGRKTSNEYVAAYYKKWWWLHWRFCYPDEAIQLSIEQAGEDIKKHKRYHSKEHKFGKLPIYINYVSDVKDEN